MANDFNGSEWAGWKTLAMSVSPDPSCTSNGRGSVICAATSTGPVACFAEGYNLYNGRSWTVGNRSAYENISGVVNANAGCPIQSGGELSVRRNRCHGRCLLPPPFTMVLPGLRGRRLAALGSVHHLVAPLGTGKVVCRITGPTNKLTSSVGP
jgi:hypothetical protein